MNVQCLHKTTVKMYQVVYSDKQQTFPLFWFKQIRPFLCFVLIPPYYLYQTHQDLVFFNIILIFYSCVVFPDWFKEMSFLWVSYWIKKKKPTHQINEQTKPNKKIHWYREQSSGYQRGGGLGMQGRRVRGDRVKGDQLYSDGWNWIFGMGP